MSAENLNTWTTENMMDCMDIVLQGKGISTTPAILELCIDRPHASLFHSFCKKFDIDNFSRLGILTLAAIANHVSNSKKPRLHNGKLTEGGIRVVYSRALSMNLLQTVAQDIFGDNWKTEVDRFQNIFYSHRQDGKNPNSLKDGYHQKMDARNIILGGLIEEWKGNKVYNLDGKE